MSGHSQTSFEVPPRHFFFCNPRSQQDARIAQRRGPPIIATTWYTFLAQKLGMLMRKSKNPEHLDAYANAQSGVQFQSTE